MKPPIRINYQLAFLIPFSKPSKAKFRNLIREILKYVQIPLERPVSTQKFFMRVKLNFVPALREDEMILLRELFVLIKILAKICFISTCLNELRDFLFFVCFFIIGY